MKTKQYKEHYLYTLEKASLGLLIFAAGLIFCYAVYAGNGTDYLEYTIPALICLVGLIVCVKALSKRVVLTVSETGLVLSYLGTKHDTVVPWTDILSMTVTQNNASSYADTLNNYTYIAVTLNEGTTHQLPKAKIPFWQREFNRPPAATRVDAYIPVYRFQYREPPSFLRFLERDPLKVYGTEYLDRAKWYAQKQLQDIESYRPKQN